MSVLTSSQFWRRWRGKCERQAHAGSFGGIPPPRLSELNEHTTMVIKNGDITVRVRQIAA